VGTGQAELLAGDLFESAEVDAFCAAGADDAVGPVAGQLSGIDVDAYAVNAKELGIVEFAVSEHLLPALAFDFGMKIAGQIARGFEGHDSDACVMGEVDEGGGHLAPVAELQAAFAEAASGDHADGVGRAAVDLDKSDEPLAVRAEGIVDSQRLQTEEGHAHAENLAGAHVAMGGLRPLKESFKGVKHPPQVRRLWWQPQAGPLTQAEIHIGGSGSDWLVSASNDYGKP